MISATVTAPGEVISIRMGVPLALLHGSTPYAVTTTRRCSSSSGSTPPPTAALEKGLDGKPAFGEIGAKGAGDLQHESQVDLSEAPIFHPLFDVGRHSSSHSHQSGNALPRNATEVLATTRLYIEPEAGAELERSG